MSRLYPTLEITEKPPPLSHVSYAMQISSTSHDLSRAASPSSYPWCTCLTISSLVLSLLFLLLAVLSPLYLTSHLTSAFNSELTVLSSSSSPTFASFQSNADNPLTLSVYLYNITNAAAVAAAASSPSSPPVAFELSVVGPFVYSDVREKLDIHWSADGSTVSYIGWQHFLFSRSASCCDDTAVVTTANLLTAALYAGYGTGNPVIAYTLSHYLSELSDADALFTSRSVHELLFGYNVSIASLPEPLLYPGFFPNRSESATVELGLNSSITTGSSSSSSGVAPHQYVQWDGEQTLYTCGGPAAASGSPCEDRAPDVLVWATQAASTVSGSDGSVFPAPVSPSSSPLLFFYPLQRQVQLQYSGSAQFEGVQALQFSFPQSLWRNVSYEPDNAVYYQLDIDGAVNASSISSFLPTFITQPGLCGVDPAGPHYPLLTLSAASSAPLFPFTSCCQCSSNNLLVHPTSGLTVQVSLASQANLLLSPLNFTNSSGEAELRLPSLPPVLLPLFFAVEEGGLTAAEAQTLLEMDVVEQGAAVAVYVTAPLSAVCALLGLLSLLWLRRRKRQDREAVQQAEMDAEAAGDVKKRRRPKGRRRGGDSAQFDSEERRGLKLSNGSRARWYGQDLTDVPEEDEDVQHELDSDDLSEEREAEEEEEEEERVRIGYRY